MVAIPSGSIGQDLFVLIDHVLEREVGADPAATVLAHRLPSRSVIDQLAEGVGHPIQVALGDEQPTAPACEGRPNTTRVHADYGTAA